MNATARTAPSTEGAQHTPAEAFAALITAAVGNASARLERTAGGLAGKLTRSAEDQAGPVGTAGAEGVKAHLRGDNPVRAAVKGLWQAGSPAVKAAVVTAVLAMILLLVASPVLLLAFLLSLLVIAAVSKTRQQQ